MAGRGNPRGNLDVKTVEAAKPRPSMYRLSDGGGLLLVVKPSGAKMWVARVTVGPKGSRKRRDMGLGGFPKVSLREARDKAREAREATARHEDPIQVRDAAQRALEAERQAEHERAAKTFRAVAELCIAAEAPGWKSGRTAALWRASLEQWAYGELGALPVEKIDRAAVLRAVQPVWTSRPATARKVLRRVGAVLRYAAAHGWRPNDNPADLRMLRYMGLPALPGGRKQPSLPWSRLPGFMAALDTMPGLAPVALRLVVLTALRSGEVRQARWSWLAFDGVPTLTVPGETMKGKRAAEVLPHRVPLSAAAIETLARAYSLRTGTITDAADLPRLVPLMRDALIFPSAKMDTPLSDMSLSAVMRRMNAAPKDGAAEFTPPWRDPDGREAVPHGFRATFSTWVDDTRPHEREAAERAHAHEIGNKVSGAYRRSDLFDRRIGLMADWAAHATSKAPAPARLRRRA